MRDYNSKYEEDNYENNYDYNPEDDNYDYYQDGSDNGNTMKGYKILIVILIVILGAVSFLYFKQV